MSAVSLNSINNGYDSGGGRQRGADPTGALDSSAAIAYWLSHATTGWVWGDAGTYRVKPGVVQFTLSDTMLMAPGATFVIDDSLGNSGGDGFLALDVWRCGI